MQNLIVGAALPSSRRQPPPHPKFCHPEHREGSPHQFYCQSIITSGDASAKPQHDSNFYISRNIVTVGNKPTNGTGRPVPYAVNGNFTV